MKKITLALTALLFAGVPAMAGASMKLGPRTTQPIGHYNFCTLYPEECTALPKGTAPQPYSGKLMALLTRVNLQVNDAITPMDDIDTYGEYEVWTYPGLVGDCEDYVLEKRRRLIAADIPAANLLITVVRQSNGEGHAILTVRTTKGDYVLDNLSNKVKRWDETGYAYLKRQDSANAGRWVSIITEPKENPSTAATDKAR